jgi:hypothetical protein
MTTLTSEELAEIEKRHEHAEIDRRRKGWSDMHTSIHMHCDRAALLAHLRASQTPPQAVTDQVERRDGLHNVIARTMKQPVYNSSEICDAVEQYLERLSASPTAMKGEA